ncbi:hypothetical protein OQJ13_16015 [Legionella sp. PATHC035]|uniref:hypothetical protein n=1 Tax=Legionella sp. PATHC035 TaxID=2992040 RepID=UPI002242EC2F|nr:hypothetical protein [Legionella sp. PATHC035]MCW8410486.1 hypothetical protein [Legionella sp. PATHC035]
MMDKNEKQTTLIKKNNNFAIPTGLVAQKRAELIAAKEQSSLRALAPVDATPLTHLTKSRPKFEHRKPSPKRRKANQLALDFLKKNEQIPSESPDRDSTTDSLKVLKKSIEDAWIAYNKYYELGVNTGQPNGWFSWWRHGVHGQKKAQSVKSAALASDNPDVIMQLMERFFEDPNTRFENHSFASYLFNEFNRLLQGDEYKLQAGKTYDSNYWYTIAEQLRSLLTQGEYEHSSYTT